MKEENYVEPRIWALPPPLACFFKLDRNTKQIATQLIKTSNTEDFEEYQEESGVTLDKQKRSKNITKHRKIGAPKALHCHILGIIIIHLILGFWGQFSFHVVSNACNLAAKDLDPSLPKCDGNLCFGGHCSWHDAQGQPVVRKDRFPDMCLPEIWESTFVFASVQYAALSQKALTI